MPKWSSPLFTDIRNALGESVVFSIWKGRPYFRSWVKPSNPQTNLQQAHRDIHRRLVQDFQQNVIVDAESPVYSAAWNEDALPFGITGYNLFMKYGRKSSIAVPATASGSGTANVTVTYTLGLPVSKAAIYYSKDGGPQVKANVELEAGEDKTVSVTVAGSGSYVFYLANEGLPDTTAGVWVDGKGVTHYALPDSAPLDEAKLAVCEVTC